LIQYTEKVKKIFDNILNTLFAFCSHDLYILLSLSYIAANIKVYATSQVFTITFCRKNIFYCWWTIAKENIINCSKVYIRLHI